MKDKRSDLEGDHSHRVCGPELIQLAAGRYVLGIHVFSVSVWRCTTVTVVLGGLSATRKLGFARRWRNIAIALKTTGSGAKKGRKLVLSPGTDK